MPVKLPLGESSLSACWRRAAGQDGAAVGRTVLRNKEEARV
jgi:hypothetical protein